MSSVRAVNQAGGSGYIPDNLVQRLVNTIGTPNFNEPRYYGGGGDGVDAITKRSQLSKSALSIVENAEELAKSDNFEMLLPLAWWSRDAAGVKTTPIVLLAVAAHFDNTRKMLSRYAPHIITRADHIKTLWEMYDILYCRGGKRKFPVGLKRTVNRLIAGTNEAMLLKYNDRSFPTFADVLKMTNYGVDSKMVNGVNVKREIVPKHIKDFLVYGKIDNPELTPIFNARKQLNSMKSFTEEAKRLALESQSTWENLCSQFGSNKTIWEFLIDNNMLGYEAVRKNLRNMIYHGVSEAHIDKVVELLVSRVRNGRQTPLSLMTTANAVSVGARGKSDIVLNHTHAPVIAKFHSAINSAITKMAMEAGFVSGRSALLIDNSGSMGQPISRQSIMTCEAAAASLAACLVESADEIHLVSFGTDARIVSIPDGAKATTITKAIRSVDVGHGTNAHVAINTLTQKGIVVDRIVAISDCQMYGPVSVEVAFKNYCSKLNPSCKLYLINVTGGMDGFQPVSPDNPNVVSISGYAEPVFRTALVAAEGGFVKKANGEIIEFKASSIEELIRTRYMINGEI